MLYIEKMKAAIKKNIQSAADKNVVIYPFGEQGKKFKEILNDVFNIKEAFVLDNRVLDIGTDLKRLDYLTGINVEEYIFFIVSDNTEYYYEIRNNISKYVSPNFIIDVLENQEMNALISAKNGKELNILFNPIYNASIRIKAEELDLQNKLLLTGLNTGNLVFTEAIKDNIKYDYELSLNSNWADVGNNVAAIMPAANFLNYKTTWIEDFVPLLEKTDIKFTLAGLGAQANENDTPKQVVSKLSETQIKFFKLVSEKAVSIGVRGEFTADCMELLGIKNIRIIGCPSFYKQNDFYPELNKPSLKRCLYSNVNEYGEKIKELASQKNAKLIRQTYEENDKNSEMFFDYYDWNNYLINNDFSFAFGSRFHGNIMALRNRIPTLWIVHDMRTTELVHTLKLPHLHYISKTFQKVKHLEELLEYCDYNEVYKEYPKLYKHYIEFLQENKF